MTAVTTAWQAALAAEHRAFFAYGLLGPRLAGTQYELAVTCYHAHGSIRDATADAIAAAKLTPVGPLADYPDLYPVDDAAVARRLAASIEDSCACAWRYLYAQASAVGVRSPTLRTAAQKGLTASAVRAAQWRHLTDPSAATEAFPGI